ncbi:MAG: hypothetical protein HY289_09280 [Planctomycetes bacterium]|nr:hypothetical protein [Planctomycetota bacterium]
MLPPPPSYPSHFTTINFCSLDYLLPKLIFEAAAEVAEIERMLPLADNDEEVRRLAQSCLDMKREHLRTLQDVAAGNSPAPNQAHAVVHEGHEGH